MKEKMKFNVDWLSIRLDGLDCPEDFVDEFLGIFPDLVVAVRPCGGVNFYKHAYNVPEAGHSSIIFGWNEDENGNYIKEEAYPTPHGLMITVSGDGCRFLNYKKQNGLYEFCKLCTKYDYNVTRIDVACDFLDKDNAIVPLIQLWAQEFYLDFDNRTYALACNMKKEGLVQRSIVYDKVLKQETFNVTVGKRDSRKGIMQLYNKRVEVENGRLSDIAAKTFEQYGVTDYWWRLEYRCKSFSKAVFENLLAHGVHAAFLSAMDNFGAFHVPQYESSACDIIAIDWQAFIDEVTALIDSEDFIHLVQLVSQPYIPADATRIMKYSDRMSVYLYKFAMLGALNPSWYKDILDEGRARFLQNNRNLAFRNELRSDYGFDVFPDVSISIPELEQISMDI